MAMSSWLNRSRVLRSAKAAAEDISYRLSDKKTPAENVHDIYAGLSSRETSDTLRLSFLNELTKLLDKHNKQSEKDGQLHEEYRIASDLGFSVEELLYLLRIALVSPLTQIRAAGLKAIRHLLRTAKDVQRFNDIQLPFLLCRSIDIVLRNEEERLQALKLVRKMLAVAPEHINPVIVKCLVSLAENNTEDRMLRACLATLCEFGVLNPTLLIMCGGVSAITRNVLETHSPRIAESLCGVLLHLLEWPGTRQMAGVRLDCLAAPYCDFTYRLDIMDKNKDARDLRFTCSRIALLSVLKSWAGIIEFCNPNNPSGLKAIIDVLYLNQVEVRKAILDLLYELIGLPQPAWTEDYAVALSVLDPADYHDSWRLSEGFVAMEGRSILPSLAANVPNVVEIHLALLLYCFLENGLLNALVQVIISSEASLSVRATVLLGKLLQLMHSLLPIDLCNTNSCLPALVVSAAEGNHQAKAAIIALQNYHQILRNRPAACSLFLDTIVQNGGLIGMRIFQRDINTKESFVLPKKLGGTLERRRRYDSIGSSSLNENEGSGDAGTIVGSGGGRMDKISFGRSKYKFLSFFDNVKESERLIKESGVLTPDQKWDWDVVVTILRSDVLGKMDDLQCRFVRTLVTWFKPSQNCFSHEEIPQTRQLPSYVTAGLDLIDWLLRCPELECMRLLTDLFSDISGQLLSISTARSAHDCLFSPQHMSSTMCQQYFLFIGRMCRSEKGINILSNTDVFKQLLHLVAATNHICYVKLIVSGLDYRHNMPRKILSDALTISPQRISRHYTTQLLLVLLRAKIPDFEVWGIPMIIRQLKDPERLVSVTALDILLEACHDKIYLEEIVRIWPAQELHLHGDDGRLVMSKFYSIPRGLNHTAATTRAEIELWVKVYNKKYVLLLESDTHASLTLHTRNEDKTYTKRTCSIRPALLPPNVPPHLYGQLVQTSQGMANLQKYGDIRRHLDVLETNKCTSEIECLNLKAALWAIGHISTSTEGVEFLNDPITRVYERIINLTKNSPVYSIRATALNVLSLVGSTRAGADILSKFDWLSVRHDRNAWWPVQEPEDWFGKNFTPLRRAIERLPPYNFTGINDSEAELGGNTSIYLDGSEENTTESRETTERSQTLPGGGKSIVRRTVAQKQSRSWSDSRADEITFDLPARRRFNSGTDSNTSGVSSIESAAGRNPMDLPPHTLSPIQSQSDLLGTTRRRRISLTGVPFNEPGPTPEAVAGSNYIRRIRRGRPNLSMSTTEGTMVLQENEPQSRSLESTSNLSGYEDFRNQLLASRALRSTNAKGPCFMGICLPKYINDLFPPHTRLHTYVSQLNALADLRDQAPPPPPLDLSLQTTAPCDEVAVTSSSLIGAGETGAESTVSSISDLSSASKRWKFTGKHDRSECLHCSRARFSWVNSRLSSYLNISAIRRRSMFDVSFNSPESVFSEESLPDRVAAQILKHVHRMSNPMPAWNKQSKRALLELKQKNPASFQDICLYSEVCRALGRNTYLTSARRFIQEIFFDLDFDSFYNESAEILSKKDEMVSLEIVEPSDEEVGDVDTEHTEKLVASTVVAPSTSSTTTISAGSSKTAHFKSPALESVYETSVENLSESLKSAKTKLLETSLPDSPPLPPPTTSTTTMTKVAVKVEKPAKNSSYTIRPRFNTLELDLSCTKNKFPIRDRRAVTSASFRSTLRASGRNGGSGGYFSATSPTKERTNTVFSTSTAATATTTTPSAQFGSLFCEQRILATSQSEAALSSRARDVPP